MRVVGSAIGTSAATLGVLVGGTLLVSTAAMQVVKMVVKQQERKRAVSCEVCRGDGTQQCAVCRGKKVLRWSPIKAAAVQRACLCPACQGRGAAVCMNCLGERVVCLPA